MTIQPTDTHKAQPTTSHVEFGATSSTSSPETTAAKIGSIFGDAIAAARERYKSSYEEGTRGMEPGSGLTVVDLSKLPAGASTALTTLGAKANTALAAAGSAVPEALGTARRMVDGSANGEDVANATAFTKKWTGFVPGMAKTVVLKTALKRMGTIDDTAFELLRNFSHSTTELMTGLKLVKKAMMDRPISAEAAVYVMSLFRDTRGEYDPKVTVEVLSILAPEIPRDQAVLLMSKATAANHEMKVAMLEVLTARYANVTWHGEVQSFVESCDLSAKETKRLFDKKYATPQDRAAAKAHFAPPPRTIEVEAGPQTAADVPASVVVGKVLGDLWRGFNNSRKA